MRCLFADQTSLTLSRFVAGFIRPREHIEFDPTAPDPSRELRVLQDGPREFYVASISYVAQPKSDQRGEYFLGAAIPASRLGLKQLHLRNEAVRDYFYFPNRRRSGCEEETLYDLLRAAPSSSPTDLRLALKVRMLELQTAGARRDQLRAVERAFNILANPELRSCYDALLVDPDAPAVFPYGGFGSIIVSGELSPDREIFFAKKILSFFPETRERRFRAPLRRVAFLDGRGVYRDSGRKAEVFLDEVLLPLSLDPTWYQWKHLVSTRFGIDATFVKSGKYRFQSGEWSLITWETALPSRLRISLPADVQDAVTSAQKTYNRFGRFFDAIQSIRNRIAHEPLEHQDLRRFCGELGIPPDFDIVQISWKPDFESFFYNQLRKRSRRLFLFREEYIFELERAIVVEVPEQGHATYVFSRSDNFEHWVHSYSRTPKEDIRRNRTNAAERLGFIGRVMHGRNPRTWLRELRAKIGEPPDYSLANAP